MVLNTENLITLQQLVKLDSDVSLVIKELPNVWNVAWKHLEVFGANNRSVFQSIFNLVRKGTLYYNNYHLMFRCF